MSDPGLHQSPSGILLTPELIAIRAAQAASVAAADAAASTLAGVNTSTRKATVGFGGGGVLFLVALYFANNQIQTKIDAVGETQAASAAVTSKRLEKIEASLDALDKRQQSTEDIKRRMADLEIWVTRIQLTVSAITGATPPPTPTAAPPPRR